MNIASVANMAENILFSSAMLILKESDSESDSSSDTEWELLKEKRKRNLRPRIKNVELVIELYTNDEFKSHFRFDNLVFYFLNKYLIFNIQNFNYKCIVIL